MIDPEERWECAEDGTWLRLAIWDEENQEPALYCETCDRAGRCHWFDVKYMMKKRKAKVSTYKSSE